MARPRACLAVATFRLTVTKRTGILHLRRSAHLRIARAQPVLACPRVARLRMGIVLLRALPAIFLCPVPGTVMLLGAMLPVSFMPLISVAWAESGARVTGTEIQPITAGLHLHRRGGTIVAWRPVMRVTITIGSGWSGSIVPAISVDLAPHDQANDQRWQA